MGGISSNGNTSAGTTGNALSQPGALSSLFMSNQPAPRTTLPMITAPQSYLPVGVTAMPTPHPVNYTPAPKPAQGITPAKDDPFNQYGYGGGYGGR